MSNPEFIVNLWLDQLIQNQSSITDFRQTYEETTHQVMLILQNEINKWSTRIQICRGSSWSGLNQYLITTHFFMDKHRQRRPIIFIGGRESCIPLVNTISTYQHSVQDQFYLVNLSQYGHDLLTKPIKLSKKSIEPRPRWYLTQQQMLNEIKTIPSNGMWIIDMTHPQLYSSDAIISVIQTLDVMLKSSTSDNYVLILSPSD